MRENKNRIIIDMSSVNYVNSSGLEMITKLLKDVRETGGDIKFFGLSEYVMDIMEMLNVAFPITIFKTKEEAIGSF